MFRRVFICMTALCLFCLLAVSGSAESMMTVNADTSGTVTCTGDGIRVHGEAYGETVSVTVSGPGGTVYGRDFGEVNGEFACEGVWLSPGEEYQVAVTRNGVPSFFTVQRNASVLEYASGGAAGLQVSGRWITLLDIPGLDGGSLSVPLVVYGRSAGTVTFRVSGDTLKVSAKADQRGASVEGGQVLLYFSREELEYGNGTPGRLGSAIRLGGRTPVAAEVLVDLYLDPDDLGGTVTEQPGQRELLDRLP